MNKKDFWKMIFLISTFFIFGIISLYFTGFFDIKSYNDFNNYILEYWEFVIIAILFIGISIYIYVSSFMNYLIKPKKKILFLLSKDENNVCLFVDKKGREFYFNDNNYLVGYYYDVLKTHGRIDSVLRTSGETFEIIKKEKSYWLNLYSPIGNFEDIFLLPILYIILVSGIMIILTDNGYKITGIFMFYLSIFIIIYDLIYKIKLRKSNNDKIDDSNMKVSYHNFENIYYSLKIIYNVLTRGLAIIMMIVVFGIIIWLFMHSADDTTRLTMFIFCILVFFAGVTNIFYILKLYSVSKIFEKIFVIIFLLFGYGALFIYIIREIKEGNGLITIMPTIPFLLGGIIIMYTEFIKKK